MNFLDELRKKQQETQNKTPAQVDVGTWETLLKGLQNGDYGFNFNQNKNEQNTPTVPTTPSTGTTTPSTGTTNNTLGNLVGNILGGVKDNVSAVVPEMSTQDPYAPYTESKEVLAAKEALAALQKPGDYTSTWQDTIDATLDKILNREEFKYDFNGDALYNQYKDQYINQGKQAMMNAIGNASALTGGFANSWAQSAGQQTFQNYLQGLNDKIPELYQLALDKYNMEGNELKDQLGLLLNQEQMAYDRFRDSITDYLTERGYLSDRYDTERNYDYSKYADNRDFTYQTDRDKVSDEQWQKEFDEAIRQYLASADPEVRAAYASLGGSLGGLGGTTGGLTSGITGGTMLESLINGLGNTGAIKVTASSSSTKKDSDAEVVNQIIRGEWGNGQARKDALKKAGYTDAEIKALQQKVNEKMAGETVKDDTTKPDTTTPKPETKTGKEFAELETALRGMTKAERKEQLQDIELIYQRGDISKQEYEVLKALAQGSDY